MARDQRYLRMQAQLIYMRNAANIEAEELRAKAGRLTARAFALHDALRVLWEVNRENGTDCSDDSDIR